MDSKRITNSKLKTMRQAVTTLYSANAQVSILEPLLKEEQRGKNDRGISVLTSVLYKSLFRKAFADQDESKSELRVLLEHAKNFWFVETLDCLRDEDKFILQIVDSLS